MKMKRWLLRLFRLAVVTGMLAWAIGTDDLSLQARAFVDDTLAGWGQSIDR
jgi:hypothetical protein